MPHRRRLKTVLVMAALLLAVAAGGGTYTVERGDTLWRIAQQHGTSARAIAEANGLANPHLIFPGQTLQIPGSTPATHQVRRGETLASIASSYGTTIQALAAANGITDIHRIYAGTQLRLTASAAAAPAPSTVVQRQIHLVQSGETLSGIALRYGTTVRAIVEANAIDDPDRIRVGTALSVPAGGFVCPVAGATFFNDWGFTRPGGRFHEGNDLFAPAGTPVVAPVAGTARHLEGPIGGLQFRLVSADGTTYVGTHLSGSGAAGQVAAGQVIGYVGDSGNARGSRPHLHFEIIRPGGESVNPYPALEEACR